LRREGRGGGGGRGREGGTEGGKGGKAGAVLEEEGDHVWVAAGWGGREEGREG